MRVGCRLAVDTALIRVVLLVAELAVGSDPSCHASHASHCTIARRSHLTLEEWKRHFRTRPVIVFNRTLPPPNQQFITNTGEQQLLSRYGDLTIRVRDFSAEGSGIPERQTTVRDYWVDKATGDHRWYWFGGTDGPEWQNLLSMRTVRPSLLEPSLEEELAAGSSVKVLLGVVPGPSTGAVFHTHGAAVAEQVHGRKHWFVYPPTAPQPPGYYPGVEHLDWVEKVLATLKEQDRPLQCVLEPGDVLYLPAFWYHATVNLDSYNVFVSSFAGNPDIGS